MKKTILFLVAACVVGTVQSQSIQIQTDNMPPLKKPTSFVDLGESFATPDAMALDKNGRLFLSVPNFANYQKLGSKICVFNEENKPVTWLEDLPKHPATNQVHPMGIDFGPDGNLYIADSQSSPDGKNISRLLKVTVADGKPIKTEVVVEGFYAANGVKWNGDRIYISDSYISVEGKKNQSGIYSFSLDDLNKGKITLEAGGTDKHLLCRFTTKIFNNKDDQGGVDGIAFDAHNNLYAGNFSDGVISKIELDKKGNLKSQSIILDTDQFRCCDGMFYDKKNNCIYMANFLNNSIHRLDLTKNKFELLWENGDATGEDGLLDQPCEPIVYKGKLLVVNFDSFPSVKNKEADRFHNISVFELQ